MLSWILGRLCWVGLSVLQDFSCLTDLKVDENLVAGQKDGCENADLNCY